MTNFTPREFRQMIAIKKGCSPERMMRAFGVSYKTIKNTNSAIRAKIGMTGKPYKENPNADRKEMEKLLSKAYPFGPREMSPYKTWLRKVKGALDLKYGYKMTDYERKKLDEIKAKSENLELGL